MARKKRVFENQRLFTPSVVRRYTNASGVLRDQTEASLSGSGPAPSPTGSFRFDPPGSRKKRMMNTWIDSVVLKGGSLRSFPSIRAT